MGVASVSEYVASLNEEQRRYVSAFVGFMNGNIFLAHQQDLLLYAHMAGGEKDERGVCGGLCGEEPFLHPFSDEAFLNRLAYGLPNCKKASGASTSNTAMRRPSTRRKRASVISCTSIAGKGASPNERHRGIDCCGPYLWHLPGVSEDLLGLQDGIFGRLPELEPGRV